MRLRARVHSRTEISPSFGKRIERVEVAPGRMSARLLRSRNDARAVDFFLKRGNLAGLPLRSPRRLSVKADSARPRSTAASSKTWEEICARQGSPGRPSSSFPASSVSFHALKVLIRSNPDQGTFAEGSLFFARSAVFTMRRHWLKAK